jgi:DNA-binding beta-propeller fold protein YncE
MKRPVLIVAAGLVFVLLWAAAGVSPMNAQSQPTPTRSFAGKVRAPEFPLGLDWINIDTPILINDLRGKVVLLDFWTYGCINCIHIIPDLKRLEKEFANELVVIGVHSAKFKNEGNTANIRYIVQRYEVEHPVVNDNEFEIWRAYGVQAWPTSVVIDPTGKVLGFYSGEGVYDALAPIIRGMVAEFDAQKLIDRTPFKVAPELAKRAPSALSFPGKVLADSAGKRLFISDSNNNRIVVADLATYEVKAIIGNGEEALKDGSFAAVSFFRPQGLAVNGDTLYVADTNNHAIRAIDLKAQTVKTIAGTGKQDNYRATSGPALERALNSPWDLAYQDGTLYIAMAGPHQLWSLKLGSGSIAPYAGSGREGLVDGALAESELAQPSGIAISNDGKVLYFADAESSSIRSADLDAGGKVRTIVGTGLFDFGDKDGTGDEVRLQHALGVTVGPDGKLYVADTYNSKIKVIDAATRESKTFLGSGQGSRDGIEAQFYEPGGLSYAEGKLYIADTNNNAIRVADLKTREVKTIKFPNAEILMPKAAATGPREKPAVKLEQPPADFFGEVVTATAIRAAPGAGKIILNVRLPEGYKLNGQAPFTLHVYNSSEVAVVAPADNDLSLSAPKMPLGVPVTLHEGQSTLTMDATIIYCEAVNETLCFPANVRFNVPLTVSKDGAKAEVLVEYTVQPPVKPNNTLGN